MDVRIAVETTFENGEKRTHQLDGMSRLNRVSSPEGFGLLLEEGKRIVEQIQRAIICDQVEEITRESRVCSTVPGFAPSMTIARAFSIRFSGDFGSKLRACVAASAM